MLFQLEWIGLTPTRLDVAFVVDTTGSMKDDIRAVKDSLFDIVEKTVSRTENLQIRFAIVSYRDHPPQDRTYVTRVFDFTDQIKKVHREISHLKPSEGGDTPEAVADGLYDARTKLSWASDAYKVLLLVGDAPPHGRQYNSLSDDYFPDGCPKGHDPIDEVTALKNAFRTTTFLFVCGCNPLVRESFKAIADAVDDGQYYSLKEANELPDAILKILEGVSDLIEVDRKVLDYYETHDGAFILADAAEALHLELRKLKISLSRLLELEYIHKWPKSPTKDNETYGIEIELGEVPSALLPGKQFKYPVKVHNPSGTVIGIRILVSLITSEGVSEVANSQHEIMPNSTEQLHLLLTPMAEEKGKATLRVEVLYGSKALALKIYNTRIY
jgi:Mg-chelatase subunit ChlD